MRCVLLAATALAAMALAGGCSQSATPELGLFAGQTNVDRPCELGQGWSFHMPGRFAHRTEDGNLLFWRKGLTVCAVVWNNDAHESATERLAWIKRHVSPDGFEPEQFQDADVLRYAYRLTERRREGVVHALYGYAIEPAGLVQMAIYCGSEADLATARKIWRSVARQSETTKSADARTRPASLQR